MFYHQVVFYSHVKVGETERSTLRSWWWDWSFRRNAASVGPGGSTEKARGRTKGLTGSCISGWHTYLQCRSYLSYGQLILDKQKRTSIKEAVPEHRLLREKLGALVINSVDLLAGGTKGPELLATVRVWRRTFQVKKPQEEEQQSVISAA